MRSCTVLGLNSLCTWLQSSCRIGPVHLLLGSYFLPSSRAVFTSDRSFLSEYGLPVSSYLRSLCWRKKTLCMRPVELNLAKQHHACPSVPRARDSKPALRSQAASVATCSLVWLCSSQSLRTRSVIALSVRGKELAVLSVA